MYYIKAVGMLKLLYVVVLGFFLPLSAPVFVQVMSTKHLDMMGSWLEMQTKAVKLTQDSDPFPKPDIWEGWGDGKSDSFNMTSLCCDCRYKSAFISG